jgi:hypothetical protein
MLPSCRGMPKKEKRTEVVSIRLKPSTRDGLLAMAEADRRPFATFLAMVLEDWFDAQAGTAKGKGSHKP